jgi:hypothetical protein
MEPTPRYTHFVEKKVMAAECISLMPAGVVSAREYEIRPNPLFVAHFHEAPEPFAHLKRKRDSPLLLSLAEYGDK